MAEARRDNNSITTLLLASNADGTTPILWYGDPATNRALVNATISGTVSTTPATSTTPSQSSVAGSASSVTLLSSNTSRLGATIFNDSTADLYVRLGTTASTSNFTIKLSQDDYYEVPFGYTGRIDGIWSSATGNARITELT